MANNWHPAVAAAQRQEKWLRIDQVAKELRLKERRALQLCENGILEAVKTGRRWWVKESVLQRYVQGINQN